MGRPGSARVAAYTTAARVDGLAVALLASLGIAVSTFAAQNYGAGRPDRIRQGVVQSVWMSVVGGVLLGAVLFTAGGHVIYRIALPMAACQIAGAFAGTRIAFAGGNRIVRALFLIVATALIIRFGWDALGR